MDKKIKLSRFIFWRMKVKKKKKRKISRWKRKWRGVRRGRRSEIWKGRRYGGGGRRGKGVKIRICEDARGGRRVISTKRKEKKGQ